jgi:hypothetical protein
LTGQRQFKFFLSAFTMFCLLKGATSSMAQDTTKSSEYILGTEEKLEMIVHIWGEVKSPGEYRVPYDTNVLELISKAGGPSAYANLSKVRLTRESEQWHLNPDDLKKLVAESRSGRIKEDKIEQSLQAHFAKRVLVYDLNHYIKNRKSLEMPPTMHPGDLIFVPQNGWYKWREIVRIAHEVAVIASVYVWYLRAQ